MILNSRGVTWTVSSAGTEGLELLPHPGKSPFFWEARGFLLRECSRSHETQTVSPNLCLWWGEALALGWCWNQVGWMTPPQLNPGEQLLEELRVPHTPLPPTYQLAREQAQGKGTAAIMNCSLPPQSELRCITTPCGAQCWQWNLSRRLSWLLHSQPRGMFKVYRRNGTCLTLGEGLKPLSLGKLGALEGSAWRKEASVASERCHSGRCLTGWFMPPYAYRVSHWRKWCRSVPQGSVHLRSNPYEPRKHLVFFNQILTKVKKSESAWGLLGGFIPLEDLSLEKSRWCRRERFFLHFFPKAQPEGLKLTIPPVSCSGKQIVTRLDTGDRKQPHTATHPGTACLFGGALERCNSATPLCP